MSPVVADSYGSRSAKGAIDNAGTLRMVLERWKFTFAENNYAKKMLVCQWILFLNLIFYHLFKLILQHVDMHAKVVKFF